MFAVVAVVVLVAVVAVVVLVAVVELAPMLMVAIIGRPHLIMASSCEPGNQGVNCLKF